MNIIRPGDRGDAVRDVQRRLLALGTRIDPDELVGTFGPSTLEAVRRFQARRGLPADGLVGPETWGELVEAGWELGDRILYLRVPPFRGDDVLGLQRRLNALGFDTGREDGIYGEDTDRAVHEFQRNIGREPDGIVGPGTLHALERLRPPLDGPSRAVVREAEAVRNLRGTLAGAIVAIDPGHGPTDPGHVGPGGTPETEADLWMSLALAEELARRGAVPSVLRDAREDPEPSERAKAANELGAACCVSLHCHADESLTGGVACSYFGTEATHSPAGERLAASILRAVTSSVGMPDRGHHRRTVAILRETAMPAVVVETGLLGAPAEEERLADPAFRGALASAVADGIEGFLGAADLDQGRLAEGSPT